jgi:hypothetical protein
MPCGCRATGRYFMQVGFGFLLMGMALENLLP